ncbi:hypothetical protein IWQ61_005856 [Dispira simplex]|nr:hypothetical protein IWQ61_005856 [Dispira simplex]
MEPNHPDTTTAVPPNVEIFDIRSQKFTSGTDHCQGDNVTDNDSLDTLRRDILTSLTTPSITVDLPSVPVPLDKSYYGAKVEKQPLLTNKQHTINVRSIPTVTLYDTQGLALFDQITYLDEYYPTDAEIDLLQQWGSTLAESVPQGTMVLELGAGSLRKTRILLDNFERLERQVVYYALDVDYSALEHSLISLDDYRFVRRVGLWGTYEDGIRYLKTESTQQPKLVLWLGSSIGNFVRFQAVDFLSRLNSALNPGDRLVLGADQPKSSDIIHRAYNDQQGITAQFILNALSHINTLLNQPLFKVENFTYQSWYNPQRQRMELYVRSSEDQIIQYRPCVSYDPPTSFSAAQTGHTTLTTDPLSQPFDITLRRGELLHVEFSHKFRPDDIHAIAARAHLSVTHLWDHPQGVYNMYILCRPGFIFSRYTTLESTMLGTHTNDKDSSHKNDVLTQDDHEPQRIYTTVPTLSEWDALWTAWNTVSLDMIPPAQLYTKPIGIRHPFVFYLGHIPAFLDRKLSQCVDEPLTEPQVYTEWFQRGIDPDVDDPTQCHPHSEVPLTWPKLHEIVEYRDRVYQKLRQKLISYGLTDGFPADANYDRDTFTTYHPRHQSLTHFNRQYDDGDSNPPTVKPISRRLARCLWMCFEHQAMHLETLLHMIVRLPQRIPPAWITPTSGVTPRAAQPADPPQWVAFPSQNFEYGLNGDDESDDVNWRLVMDDSITQLVQHPITTEEDANLAYVQQTNLPETIGLNTLSLGNSISGGGKVQQQHVFGWDNEKPRVKEGQSVNAFAIQNRPVTIKEYADTLWAYLTQTHNCNPTSSTVTPGSPTEGANEITPEDGCPYLPQSWVLLSKADISEIPDASIQNPTCISQLDDGYPDNPKGCTTFNHNPLHTRYGVRMIWGDVPLVQVAAWPVFVSQQQSQFYADWHQARLPTESELRLAMDWYHHRNHCRSGLDTVERGSSENDDEDGPLQESPLRVNRSESFQGSRGHPSIDNYGFVRWGPTPVISTNKPAGALYSTNTTTSLENDPSHTTLTPSTTSSLQSTTDERESCQFVGDGWEWTSTPFSPLNPPAEIHSLEKQRQFTPSELYPGYSADFFDDKHFVVLGGSWATHPRIAQRATFRNWYQAKYPFAFITFRLCRSTHLARK